MAVRHCGVIPIENVGCDNRPFFPHKPFYRVIMVVPNDIRYGTIPFRSNRVMLLLVHVVLH